VTASDDDRIAYLAGEPVESLSAQERAELGQLRELLQARATWVEPDSTLEDRVVATIGEEVDSRPARAPARRPAFWPRRVLRRPAFAIAGAVAALAAVVLVDVAISSNAPAPQQFALVVSGTALAPGAHGSATLTKTSSGWRIQLSASGLQHVAGDRYYQAWVKNAAGILVPVGTFNDARQVTLWSGVPITQYRTLTVTEQLANGNPASSGERVLTGTISASR
jgi:Anti-sigma-K factor rskA